MGGLDPTGKSPVFSSHPQLFYPPKFARSSIDPKPVCTGFEPHAFSPNIKFYRSALFETPKGWSGIINVESENSPKYGKIKKEEGEGNDLRKEL